MAEKRIVDRGGAENMKEKEKDPGFQENQGLFHWRTRRDSNPRPSESESDALSNWATGTWRMKLIILYYAEKEMSMTGKGGKRRQKYAAGLDLNGIHGII